MNKIKYIFMLSALVLSTAVVILVPELIKMRQDLLVGRSILYIDNSIVEESKLTSADVAEVISKGKMIYGYTNAEYVADEDLDQLKGKSIEIIKTLFADDISLSSKITDEISASDIIYNERKNYFAVIDDRLAVLDLVIVNFSSDIGVVFEEKTSTVIDFYRYSPYISESEIEELIKRVGLCSENYYSFLEDSTVNYSIISDFYNNNCYVNISIEPYYENDVKEILN